MIEGVLVKQSLKELYKEVSLYISKIDFNKLWSRFYPLRFALYDDNHCYFDGQYITKTNDFLANTAIEYQGENIAIWNVMEEVDPKYLASKMIHEMFHGFQRINNESRFPNETNAIYNYHYSNENLSIKFVENQLIIELVKEFDKDKFELLLSLKKYRQLNHNYEFNYEAKIEQIEGSANYVELSALKEIDYKLYLNKLEEMIDSLKKPEKLFPVRIISYDSGALLLHILKENKIDFSMGFSDATFIEKLIENVLPILNPNDLFMSPYISSYFNNSKKIIDNAVAKKNIVLDKSVKLLGFNVYNAVYLDGYIISKYFIMYEDEKPIILYGDFVIETHSEGIITKIYKTN